MYAALKPRCFAPDATAGVYSRSQTPWLDKWTAVHGPKLGSNPPLENS